jgi:hypothetical protein
LGDDLHLTWSKFDRSAGDDPNLKSATVGDGPPQRLADRQVGIADVTRGVVLPVAEVNMFRAAVGDDQTLIVQRDRRSKVGSHHCQFKDLLRLNASTAGAQNENRRQGQPTSSVHDIFLAPGALLLTRDFRKAASDAAIGQRFSTRPPTL